MVALIDTDIFCKLGVSQLLEESLALFDTKLEDCFMLPALPHMLKRGKLLKGFGQENCNDLIPVANRMKKITDYNIEILEKLTPISNIDPGEALLFAAAVDNKDSVIMTGDKRALTVLKEFDEITDLLIGRVVTLEAVLIALCRHLGTDIIRKKIEPYLDIDIMIKVIFSPGNDDPLEALLSYYRSLSADLDQKILWDPESTGEI